MENFQRNQSIDEIIGKGAEEKFFSRSIAITGATFAILFSIVGIVGNIMTVIAMLKHTRLRRNATTAFVISLSISDLIFSAVNLPVIASEYLYQAWILGDTLCQIFPLCLYGDRIVSVLNRVAITINRFVLIVKFDIYASLYTSQGIALMLTAIWIVGFSVLIPTLLGVWGTFGLNPATSHCTILKKNGKSPVKMLHIIGFIVPCIVMIVSYLCIYWKLRKSRKNLEAHSGGRKKDGIQKREDSRVTKVMLMLFICFLVCFMPAMLVHIIDEKRRIPILHVISYIFAWASHVINPFIYAGTSKLYREAYRQVLCPLRER